MDDVTALSGTERLLLRAAYHAGLGADTDLSRANASRVVDAVLLWLGLTPEEIVAGWRLLEDRAFYPAPGTKYVPPTPGESPHEDTHRALVGLVHGPLFEGGGNWGTPGDPEKPACFPQYASCRLTRRGEEAAEALLGRERGGG